MDVSPQLLREVEFREQWRGYNPDEVDDFLERLAVALEELQARLRETADRATHAERRLLDTSGDDDELRRTLVLARRTADVALDEARAEAAGIEAEAEARAEEVRADAERLSAELREEAERHAARVRADAEARAEVELGALADRRRQLEGEADAMQAYVDDQRHRLHQEMREQLAWIEQPGRLEMPPRPGLSPLDAKPVQARTAEGGDRTAVVVDRPAEQVAETRDVEDDTGPHPVVNGACDDAAAGEPTGFYDVLAEDDHPAAGGSEADPFLAELRRAVDDPEPLGPRESRTDWADDDDGGDKGGPGRNRWRRI
ncbi:MAG TPA: DivIVA domain-containing protein [Acidimicrobiales bacterium]|nr:DivIVA domain-containing protein [Acidimicrobiales bacterium]